MSDLSFVNTNYVHTIMDHAGSIGSAEFYTGTLAIKIKDRFWKNLCLKGLVVEMERTHKIFFQ